MRAPRVLLPALILTVTGLAVSPAHAALPEPTWLAPQAVSDPGQLQSDQDSVSVKMSATGGALVGWNRNNGSYNELHGRYRAVDGTLSEEVLDISTPGIDASNPSWLALSNGDILVAWPEQNGGSKIMSRTVHPDGTMSPREQLSSGDNASSGADLAQDTNGNVYLSYASDQAYLSVRVAGSSHFSDPVPIPGSNGTSDTRIAVGLSAPAPEAPERTPDGTVTVVWASGHTLCTATRTADGTPASADTDWAAGWSSSADVPPVSISDTPDNLGMTQLAADDHGRVVATWVEQQGGDMTVHANIRSAAGFWNGHGDNVGGSGTFLPQIATNGSDFVTTWLRPGGSAGMDALNLDLTAGASSWPESATVQNPAGELAASIGLTVRPDGSIYTVTMHGTDMGHALPGTIGRSPAGVWGAISSPTDEFVLPTAGGGVSSDDQGNVALAWAAGDGSAMLALADGAGPAVNPTVPASATVGDEVSVSAATADRFSGGGSTTWDFGPDATVVDGDTAIYTTAGKRTVTVTATDALGHATSVSRTITVADAPSLRLAPVPEQEQQEEEDEVDPLPAILRGKVVTFLAQVKLRPGKRCSGKATATTVFGKTTYRTTLKLALTTFPESGRVCVGTGSIRLKKTPSARTKLRVTISSKISKTRTVTTTRG